MDRLRPIEISYSRGTDGQVFRALSLLKQTFANERWSPHYGLWGLASELVEDCVPIDVREVAELIEQRDQLVAKAATQASIVEAVGHPPLDKLGKRGSWLAAQIEETVAYLVEELPIAQGEVSSTRFLAAAVTATRSTS